MVSEQKKNNKGATDEGSGNGNGEDGSVVNIEVVLPKFVKPVVFPYAVKNKMKRQKLYGEYKGLKKKEKKARRIELKKLREKYPELVDHLKTKTIESKRISDETEVQADDDEMQFELTNDEISSYFTEQRAPKIAITTTLNPSEAAVLFAITLEKVIPEVEYFPRNEFPLKEIIGFSKNRDYTDLLVVNEDQDIVNSLMHCHLPDGPTATYKLSSLKYADEIPNAGPMSKHRPELILNNFHTRLGLNIGRMFASLFPHNPDFKGRRVITFHNQRDFIFFRHHRYLFDGPKRVGIQEIGPRFTLKLKSLQHGTFDSKFGEVEYVKHATDRQSKNRLKFSL